MTLKMKKLFAILHSVFWVLALVPSTVFAPFVAFLYDDPAAGSLSLYAFTFLWFFAPLIQAGSLIGFWVSLKKSNAIWQKRWMLIPYIHVFSLVILGLFFFDFS